MNKIVELPIIEPVYSTYHNQGAASAIISSNPSIRNHFLNEIMILNCSRKFLSGFTTPEIGITSSSFLDNPYLDKKWFSSEYLNGHINAVIKYLLDSGHYVDFGGVDDYYIKGKSWYKERHFNHDGLICGYNREDKTYCMLPRWTLQNVVETLLGAAFAIISAYCPALSFAMLTAEIISGYFFTNLVENATNAAAELYIEQSYKPEYASKLSKQFAWAIEIVKLIPSLLESALPPDIDEAQIAIYQNAYQNESYMIKISDNNQTVDLNEFIEHYKSLIPEN